MKNNLFARGTLRAFFLTIAVSAAVPAAVFAQQPAPGAEDELVIKARAFMEALSRSDFQAAVKDFDETMLKASGPEKLAEFWKQVPRQLGVFQKLGAAR